MIKLQSITYDKAKLLAAPETERLMYLLLAHVANETNMLQKQLLFLLNERKGEHSVERTARASAGWTLTKLLAGRLYEAWNVIRNREHAAVYRTYRHDLTAEAAEARKKINAYFNDAGNLIGVIRQKVAFHIDYDTVKDGYDHFPSAESFTDYLCNEVGNTFYEGGANLAQVSLKHLTGIADMSSGLKRVADDVIEMARILMLYVREFLRVFVFRHLKPTLDELERSEIRIVDAPKLLDVHTPFFCELPAKKSP